MGAQELLQQGDLTAAVEAATAAVKAKPGDTPARIFLFELLAAAGEFERAQKHLDVVADKAPGMAQGAGSYRAVLAAEIARARLFARGEGAPQRMTHVPLDPEPMLGALHRVQAGAAGEAAAMLATAAEARAPRPGAVDGRRFDDWRDADDLLAPVLEVIANGLYGWIPFAQIARLAFERPRYLRDLLWRPVTITLLGGESAAMFVPVRYPGSETAADDVLRLGRSTEWRETDGLVTGIGQRTFLAGDEGCAVLEASEVVFDG
jgi:type VI secretion system protein ImpE